MTGRQAVTAAVLLVTLLALLGAPAPTSAHSSRTLQDASMPSVDTAASTTHPVVRAMPEPSTIVPWLLVVGALGAALVSHRRSRRVLGLALVLLLCVFAFEDGLHSVHHGVGRAERAACAIATASAHLTLVTFDAPVVSDVILPAVAFTAERNHPAPIARFLCPVQGRAPPPSAIV